MPQVLVVGAGPVGLLLAGDLAAAGVDVTVLEQQAEHTGPIKAYMVLSRSLELLDARGVADELVAGGRRLDTVRLFGAGEIDLGHLPTRYPHLLVTPQSELERVLRARAVRCGARIETGVMVVGVRPDGCGVHVAARDRRGRHRWWQAQYAVGADGRSSTVRSELGIGFPGRSQVPSLVIADVRVRAVPPVAQQIMVARDAFALWTMFRDGWLRVIAWDRDDQQPAGAPVTLANLRRVTDRLFAGEITIEECRHISRIACEERLASRFREGRAFLAGDAAHVHPAAGGIGMNLGLLDAANLSWRLAAAVHGWAPPGTLEGYERECRAVAWTALRSGSVQMHLTTLRSALLRGVFRAAIGTAARVGPLRHHMAAAIAGHTVRYPTRPGSAAAVGRHAPDVALAGGRHARLYEALRSGRFVLVSDQAPCRGWHDRLEVVTPAQRGEVLLVRPDCYVAWSSDRADRTTIDHELRRLLGPAAGGATGGDPAPVDATG